MRTLLSPDEHEDEFDALAAGWICEYQDCQSPAIENQIVKLIQADWLYRRALLSIARAEHTLAWAEAQHESREQIEEMSKFIRRLTRRCASYEHRFDGALKRLEAYRMALPARFALNHTPAPSGIQVERNSDEHPEYI